MENNWSEKAKQIFENNWEKVTDTPLSDKMVEVMNYAIVAMLEAMNLVFEATKKECADITNTIKKKNKNYVYPNNPKRHHNIGYNKGVDKYKESILNINKPNL